MRAIRRKPFRSFNEKNSIRRKKSGVKRASRFVDVAPDLRSISDSSNSVARRERRRTAGKTFPMRETASSRWRRDASAPRPRAPAQEHSFHYQLRPLRSPSPTARTGLRRQPRDEALHLPARNWAQSRSSRSRWRASRLSELHLFHAHLPERYFLTAWPVPVLGPVGSTHSPQLKARRRADSRVGSAGRAHDWAIGRRRPMARWECSLVTMPAAPQVQ